MSKKKYVIYDKEQSIAFTTNEPVMMRKHYIIVGDLLIEHSMKRPVISITDIVK